MVGLNHAKRVSITGVTFLEISKPDQKSASSPETIRKSILEFGFISTIGKDKFCPGYIRVHKPFVRVLEADAVEFSILFLRL